MFFIWTSNSGTSGAILGLFMVIFQLIMPILIQQQRQEFIFPLKCLLIVLGVSYYIYQSRRNDNDAGDATTIRGTFRGTIHSFRNHAQGLLSRHSGYQWTTYSTSIFLISIAVAFIATVLVADVSTLLSLIQVAAIGTTLYNFVNNNDGPGGGHHQQRGGRARETEITEEMKLEQLVAIVQKMPIELFVNEEQMKELPTKELKQMLLRRGIAQQEMKSFIDRQNLLEALQQKRKFNDTCCICFEMYQEGDPLRILPNCGHELHVECLDKWAYTFALNSTKRKQSPTCPLCKEKM